MVCNGLFATSWTIYSPWNSPGQNTGVGSLSLLQGIFPRIEARSPTLQEDSLQAEPQGKPKNTGVSSLSLLQRIFPTQESYWGPYIAGGFLANWAMREALLLLVWVSFTSLLVFSRFWLLTWFYLDQILFTQLHKSIWISSSGLLFEPVAIH